MENTAACGITLPRWERIWNTVTLEWPDYSSMAPAPAFSRPFAGPYGVHVPLSRRADIYLMPMPPGGPMRCLYTQEVVDLRFMTFQWLGWHLISTIIAD